MSMKTITLKLYKPSKRKCRIIDQAMLDYSRAYQYLLDKAYEQIDVIQRNYVDDKGNYRAVNISKWVDRDISRELNRFNIEPLKDSLKIDFGITLASFLSLKRVQDNVSFPIAHLPATTWEEKCDRAMAELTAGHMTPAEYTREMIRLAKKCGELKPLFFCRYAIDRDYCLLYDIRNNKYYAKLYLLNVKSEERKAINAACDKELRYIHKDNKILETGSRKERFILVPLSFGKWQEQYLKKAVNNPEMLRTARLTKKGGEYFLSINIDVGEAEMIKTLTFLGVARGLKNPIYYSIADHSGKISGNGIVTPDIQNERDKYTIPDSGYIHRIANKIVKIALENKSQVIMQSLIDKGDRLQWVDENRKRHVPLLNCYSYNKLLGILEYKLPENGLPPPVKVSPVGIYYTCSGCGLHSKQNRFSKDMFICVACGTAMDIEYLGSINLARRLVQYSKGVLKVKVERTPSGIKFINKDIGLEYCPSNPWDCLEEFGQEIRRIIQDFYKNMDKEARSSNFKKKYSLIKKIEEVDDITRLVRVI